MNEQQVKELAERLRRYVYNDGSFYGFERVITNFLRGKRLLKRTPPHRARRTKP